MARWEKNSSFFLFFPATECPKMPRRFPPITLNNPFVSLNLKVDFFSVNYVSSYDKNTATRLRPRTRLFRGKTTCFFLKGGGGTIYKRSILVVTTYRVGDGKRQTILHHNNNNGKVILLLLLLWRYYGRRQQTSMS